MKTIAEYKQMLVAEGLLASDNAETADFSQEVTDVSYNSLTVKPGTLFLCKGANFKEAYLRTRLPRRLRLCGSTRYEHGTGCTLPCDRGHPRRHFEGFRLLF